MVESRQKSLHRVNGRQIWQNWKIYGSHSLWCWSREFHQIHSCSRTGFERIEIIYRRLYIRQWRLYLCFSLKSTKSNLFIRWKTIRERSPKIWRIHQNSMLLYSFISRRYDIDRGVTRWTKRGFYTSGIARSEPFNETWCRFRMLRLFREQKQWAS